MLVRRLRWPAGPGPSNRQEDGPYRFPEWRVAGRLRFDDAYSVRASEAGLVHSEGRNLTMEYRWAGGGYQAAAGARRRARRSRASIAIVRLGGAAATLAAKNATTTVPVVFTSSRNAFALASSQASTGPAATSPAGPPSALALLEAPRAAQGDGCPAFPMSRCMALRRNPGNRAAPAVAGRRGGGGAGTRARDLAFEMRVMLAELDLALSRRSCAGGATACSAARPFLHRSTAREIASPRSRERAPRSLFTSRQFAAKAGGLLSYGPDHHLDVRAGRSRLHRPDSRRVTKPGEYARSSSPPTSNLVINLKAANGPPPRRSRRPSSRVPTRSSNEAAGRPRGNGWRSGLRARRSSAAGEASRRRPSRRRSPGRSRRTAGSVGSGAADGRRRPRPRGKGRSSRHRNGGPRARARRGERDRRLRGQRCAGGAAIDVAGPDRFCLRERSGRFRSRREHCPARGRITGVQSLFSDVTSKRLALLKELLPAARRVITFYSPNNATGTKAVQVASDAARVLGLDFVARACRSPEEVLARISALASERPTPISLSRLAGPCSRSTASGCCKRAPVAGHEP